MTPVAGIIRHDGQPIPDDWIGALLARTIPGSGTWRVVRDASTAIVFPRPTDPVIDTSDTIVAGDARIDNRIDLRAQLGPTSPETGDLGLVRAADARWHEHCAEHLDGDFTVAIWDGVTRRLLLARDALVRPVPVDATRLVRV